MNNKIIIDTDPWVDDALAIMYAIKSWCKIDWITTVFWNSDIENTTKNSLKIISLMNSYISVYKWISNPIKVNKTFAVSHWDWGFWGVDFLTNNTIEKIEAVTYLVSTLEKIEDKISIICLWPVTNIAKVITLRPDLTKKIDELIILWWVIWEKWNITDYAEFNVYNDPDALKIVLSFELNIYLIPINICRKVFFTIEDFNNINNKNISNSIKNITNQYIYYYQNNKSYGNFKWGVMYDLLATTFFTNRELFLWETTFINVVTKWINIWETFIQKKLKSNCNLINYVDDIAIKKLFFNTMNL